MSLLFVCTYKKHFIFTVHISSIAEMSRFRVSCVLFRCAAEPACIINLYDKLYTRFHIHSVTRLIGALGWEPSFMSPSQAHLNGVQSLLIQAFSPLPDGFICFLAFNIVVRSPCFCEQLNVSLEMEMNELLTAMISLC